jgi:hypothetical protein
MSMQAKLSTLLMVAALAAGLRQAGAEKPNHEPPRGGAGLLDRVLSVDEADAIVARGDAPARWQPYRMSMTPAQWLWLPSRRTLPNTFVLFRRDIELKDPPCKAAGWITADSRYRLTVNGTRVQWGPAPCDPREMDVDPFDVTALLRPGKNTIGVEVLYYGVGDGTWPAGKPGMIFNLAIDHADGRHERIVSDPSWQMLIDRAHRPGQFKRWYLRALQEEFDARRHPFGWDTPEFSPLPEGQGTSDWLTPAVLRCTPDKPPVSTGYGYSGTDTIERVDPEKCCLRMRQIPALKETEVPAMRLADAGRVHWLRDPADWFEFRLPNCFRIERQAARPHPSPLPEGERIEPKGPRAWQLPATADPREGLFLTFEFREEIVGWPHFTIEAPEGTIVEVISQEAHDPQGPAWLDTQYFAWSRFICRAGVNRFEPFDFEALRWLQLHVRNARGPVVIREVGVRRRAFDWPQRPELRCSDPALQRLFDASINTVSNSAQETCVDGMARERQQYSGDGAHQLLAVRCAFGERRFGERFLRTFSEGITPEGYFLDAWPAYDRLARVPQRIMDGTFWGPLLDASVAFNFDCWRHYLETGDLRATDEAYPRLLRFASYLESIRDKDGLLPVENLGIPQVWMDHIAYQQQRHKQCAFNLYAAAMLERALAPLARARGDRAAANEFARRGRQILGATVRKFWSAERGLFVNNLPWLAEEKGIRLCDRSLAMAILFDQCPHGDTAASLRALVACPPEMGLSYPCNACWRYWALARSGRADVVVRDFRQRWATMKSVVWNNTLQEDWNDAADSPDEWSHCCVSPIFVTFSDLAGIRPLAPGFTRCHIRPQLGDLPDLKLTYHTVLGPIHFAGQRLPNGHRYSITVPKGCEAELLLPSPDHPGRLTRHRLESGVANSFFDAELPTLTG